MSKASVRAAFWGAAGGSLLAAAGIEFGGALQTSADGASRSTAEAAWIVAGALGLIALAVELRSRARGLGQGPGASGRLDEELLLRLHTQGLVSSYTPSLAHDGNNALLELRFQLAELRRLHDSDGATRSLADGMDGSVTVLEELIRRLRGISGSGASQSRAAYPLDLAALVRHTLAGLRTHLRSRACEARESLPDGLAAHGNARDLEQLVFSLLLHAVARTGDGGNVTIELTTDAGRAHLMVHDDGPRPEPAELELGKRPLEATLADPDGLKLWASGWYAHTHGGELRLEASPFGGLLRRAVLPLTGSAPEVAILEADADADDAAASSDEGATPRIRS